MEMIKFYWRSNMNGSAKRNRGRHYNMLKGHGILEWVISNYRLQQRANIMREAQISRTQKHTWY